MDPRRVLTFRRRRAPALVLPRAPARELSLFPQPSRSQTRSRRLQRELGVATAHVRARRPQAHRRGPDPARARGRDRRALPARRRPARRRRRGSARASAHRRVPHRARRARPRRDRAPARPHPDAKVTVDEGTDDLPARVRAGELHLALALPGHRALPRESRPASNAATSCASGSWSRSPPTTRSRTARIRIADLSDDDWTAASTDGLIVRACRAAGFKPNLVSITHDQLAIRALIRRGLAVTLASRRGPASRRGRGGAASPPPQPAANAAAAATATQRKEQARCRELPSVDWLLSRAS